MPSHRAVQRLIAFGALSFFHRARRCLSFGKAKERQGGALRRSCSVDTQSLRKNVYFPTPPGTGKTSDSPSPARSSSEQHRKVTGRRTASARRPAALFFLSKPKAPLRLCKTSKLPERYKTSDSPSPARSTESGGPGPAVWPRSAAAPRPRPLPPRAASGQIFPRA